MESADDFDDFEKPYTRRDKKRRNRRLRLLVGTVTKKPKSSKWLVLESSKVKRDERFEEKPIGLGVFAIPIEISYNLSIH